MKIVDKRGTGDHKDNTIGAREYGDVFEYFGKLHMVVDPAGWQSLPKSPEGHVLALLLENCSLIEFRPNTEVELIRNATLVIEDD